jgi:hypothetical protein
MQKLPITYKTWILVVTSVLVVSVASAHSPASPDVSYALTFVRKVGANAGHVLALPDGVAFSQGDTLMLYSADAATFLGSLPLSCGIVGLGVVNNNVIASTCDGVAVVDITNRRAPRLVRAFGINTDICPMYDESGIMGMAASGDYAYIGLWTSGCVLNWRTGQTLYDIGEWVTQLQVYRGHLFTLEANSAYDEEVVVHGGLPQPVWEDEVEVQYATNDFAVAADKVFSTAASPENEGLCASRWDPNPANSGARIDCLYSDETGAFGVAASADSVRGDNVFTVRSGRLRWVKSAGTAALVEVASVPYTGGVGDLGTGSNQYVYAASGEGLSVFRFQHLQPTATAPAATATTPPATSVPPTPDTDPSLSLRLYIPLVFRTP